MCQFLVISFMFLNGYYDFINWNASYANEPNKNSWWYSYFYYVKNFITGQMIRTSTMINQLWGWPPLRASRSLSIEGPLAKLRYAFRSKSRISTNFRIFWWLRKSSSRFCECVISFNLPTSEGSSRPQFCSSLRAFRLSHWKKQGNNFKLKTFDIFRTNVTSQSA